MVVKEFEGLTPCLVPSVCLGVEKFRKLSEGSSQPFLFVSLHCVFGAEILYSGNIIYLENIISQSHLPPQTLLQSSGTWTYSVTWPCVFLIFYSVAGGGTT